MFVEVVRGSKWREVMFYCCIQMLMSCVLRCDLVITEIKLLKSTSCEFVDVVVFSCNAIVLHAEFRSLL